MNSKISAEAGTDDISKIKKGLKIKIAQLKQVLGLEQRLQPEKN